MLNIKKQLEQDIELAKMMHADLDKVYAKYQKAAMAAADARNKNIMEKIYKGCSNIDELNNAYGYGELTTEEFYEGREFFEDLNIQRGRLSLIELHRGNIKTLRDKWGGTAKELQQELNELNGIRPDTRTHVEKLELEEREDRYRKMF